MLTSDCVVITIVFLIGTQGAPKRSIQVVKSVLFILATMMMMKVLLQVYRAYNPQSQVWKGW